jgi:hypothetical protein
MKSTLLPEWESGFSIPLIQSLNPTYAKVTLQKYRILMDSKNPMRVRVLELGEQIKQKFSREDTKCPTREPVSREHSEGKKIVKKNMKRF